MTSCSPDEAAVKDLEDMCKYLCEKDGEELSIRSSSDAADEWSKFSARGGSETSGRTLAFARGSAAAWAAPSSCSMCCAAASITPGTKGGFT